MESNELEERRKCNELDLLYKIIEIAEGKKRRTEQLLRGNGAAGTDIRHSMQDIRLLAELIRESIQINKGTKKVDNGDYKGEFIELTKIEKAIVDKRLSIEKEDANIKRAENLRRSKKKENIK
jgi:hypothetical protein